MKKFLFILLIFGLIFTIGCESQKYEDNYKDGVNLIKNLKWNEAIIKLTDLKEDNYKDSIALCDYASAQLYFSSKEYIAAYSCIKNIPNDYNGLMSEEILKFKKDLSAKAVDIQNKTAYQDGITLMKNKKWNEAFQILASLAIHKYQDSPLLYNYAYARYYGDMGLYDIAREYIKDIPLNYNGEFSDEILKYKEEIKFKKDVLKEKSNTKNNISSDRISSTDNGYKWNYASYNAKVALCIELSHNIKGKNEWKFYFDLLNSTYNTSDSYILEQSILSIATMGSAVRNRF